MDFAKRAYDHSFHIDPIVRSYLDTDFYKLLMLQFIWSQYLHTSVTFKMTNRTKSIKLAKSIDMRELQAQLDYVKNLHWREKELIWLAGQRFYGMEGIFHKGFIDYLRHSFKLSDYTLGQDEDGQIILTFSGPWVSTTMWEIYALTIVNEMRYRKIMKGMTAAQLERMYTKAKMKLFCKLERLAAALPNLNLSDFGTRRRHSFLWQRYCVQMACEILGKRFTGTSNCYIAMEEGLEAKGTNAHELPMVLAALAAGSNNATDADVRAAQYKVCQQWQEFYRGSLLVCLPDTFGTTQFLENAPLWLNHWVGMRPDSKEPIAAGEEMIDWYVSRDQKPETKLAIFADGMDVEIPGYASHGADIVKVQEHFEGRLNVGFGWGTMLTNDFVGCHPGDSDAMKAISLVCKVDAVNGHPAVKLSDNYEKATSSDPAEVERYRAIFGSAGMANVPVEV